MKQNILSRNLAENLTSQEDFVPHPGADTLIVLFTPGRFPQGKFAYKRSFSTYPTHILYVRDETSSFYTWRLEHLQSLVELISTVYGVQRRIFWGSSAGAYGALALRMMISDAETFCFSPHLCLTHEFSSAWEFIKSGIKFNPKHIDLRASLRSLQDGGPVHLYFPLRSGKDSIHVSDSVTMRSSIATATYTRTHHGIEAELKAVNQYHDFISAAFKGEVPDVGSLEGNAHEVGEALMLRDLYVSEYSDRLSGINLQEYDTQNYELMYWSARQSYRQGNVYAAVGMCQKAIEIASDAPAHYHITLANFAFNANLRHIAARHYEIGFDLERQNGLQPDEACLANYQIVTNGRGAKP